VRGLFLEPILYKNKWLPRGYGHNQRFGKSLSVKGKAEPMKAPVGLFGPAGVEEPGAENIKGIAAIARGFLPAGQPLIFSPIRLS
jgi:hypothetical protein